MPESSQIPDKNQHMNSVQKRREIEESLKDKIEPEETGEMKRANTSQRVKDASLPHADRPAKYKQVSSGN